MNALGNFTWKEFKDEVKKLLAADGNVVGAEDLVEAQIKLAALDLQTHVPQYRDGQETLYHPADFVVEGKACRGTLPPGQTREMYLIKDERNVTEEGRVQRFPVIDLEWSRRFEMIHGQVDLSNYHARVAVDPEGQTFYIDPLVEEPWLVSLNWSGTKVDFQDDEQTPFEMLAVEAAAERVAANLARRVDRDLQLAGANMANYVIARRRCVLEMRKRGDF